MTRSQAEKGAAFKALHERPGCFVMPNPWDAGSAHLLAGLGFEALATTSAGFAFSIGRRDGEGKLSRDDVLENARVIIGATDLPVSADLEGGFGDAPEAAAKTITEAARAGLVGGSIEDATGCKDAPIHDFGLAVERVKAAVAAARALPFPFTLTARAENLAYGRHDMADTIRRLQAYQGAGADVLFAPGLKSEDDIRTITRAVDRPVNVVIGLHAASWTVEKLTALGVKRISLGSSFSRAALGAFLRAAEEVKERGSFSFVSAAIPYGKINGRF
ncbi:MAG: isocitrate lyase/phosphoenolpyruvate mutase family protein [Alphaproteobacteria bacterium]|nr:isocitrate lyase/phosphoenolpyruvate mutase family protein [Alphaproteobacteria bacterium]